MSTRAFNAPAFLTVAIFLATVVLVSALVGCAPPTTGPGTPDAIQQQHYEMVKSAIEAKSKTDALAALKLLDADMSRWRVDTATTAVAMVHMMSITGAVEKEDWALAKEWLLSLTLYYRGSQ